MNSNQFYQKAQKVIPSGVNSPVRAFQAVGGNPIFIKRGKGSYLWSEDGKRYLDFCASWGPMIFGHAPQGLIHEVQKSLKQGTSFGAPTAKEVELAEKISKLVPSIQKIRLTSSGTEAVMSAIRLARGWTDRKKILKIDGGYHGHVDSLLIKAGSGGATFGVPDSAGIPDELSRLTLTIPFNDEAALEKIFRKQGKEIAAFILEPVPANMGVVLPKPGYLGKARMITKKYGSLLIFDEVITGFRLGSSGAQGLYGIEPDITCLGKILGGGFPLAAFGGRAEITDQLAPQGSVYQAGTLSGNPVAVTAALWMMNQFSEKKAWQKKLNQTSETFFSSLKEIIRKNHWPVSLNHISSIFTLFFTPGPVTDYDSAKTSSTKRYAQFFHECLKRGIYLAPAQFEANFISTTHTASQLKQTLAIFSSALRQIF